MEVDGQESAQSSEDQRWNPAWLAAGTAGGLLVLLLPALFMHRRLMNNPPEKQFLENE